MINNNDKRIKIIMGHYGSGKSEFAANYALIMREKVEGKFALTDLDVVNVYFRTRSKKEMFESKGIHVISSSVDAPTLDIPALSAEVHTPLLNKDYFNIIDMGGDRVGATVLGRYKGMLQEDDCEVLFVVNANREKTQTAEEVIDYIREIETASGMKITGLINNTHLLKATTIEDVIKGQEVCKQVKELTNIPIRFISCIEKLVDKIPADFEGEIVPIALILRDDWMM